MLMADAAAWIDRLLARRAEFSTVDRARLRVLFIDRDESAEAPWHATLLLGITGVDARGGPRERESVQRAGKVEHHGQCVLGHWYAVRTGRVGEDDVALHQLRRQRPTGARGAGVDPAQASTCSKRLRRDSEAAIDLGIRKRRGELIADARDAIPRTIRLATQPFYIPIRGENGADSFNVLLRHAPERVARRIHVNDETAWGGGSHRYRAGSARQSIL